MKRTTVTILAVLSVLIIIATIAVKARALSSIYDVTDNVSHYIYGSCVYSASATRIGCFSDYAVFLPTGEVIATVHPTKTQSVFNTTDYIDKYGVHLCNLTGNINGSVYRSQSSIQLFKLPSHLTEQKTRNTLYIILYNSLCDLPNPDTEFYNAQ